jgi:hypothetical protein
VERRLLVVSLAGEKVLAKDVNAATALAGRAGSGVVKRKSKEEAEEDPECIGGSPRGFIATVATEEGEGAETCGEKGRHELLDLLAILGWMPVDAA